MKVGFDQPWCSGYVPARPALPPLRVWGKNPGQPAAVFEVTDAGPHQARGMVKRLGYQRVLIEVK